MKMTNKQKNAIWYSKRKKVVHQMLNNIQSRGLLGEWSEFQRRHCHIYFYHKNSLNAFCKLHNIPVITIMEV